jgi:hypothetical protein
MVPPGQMVVTVQLDEVALSLRLYYFLNRTDDL